VCSGYLVELQITPSVQEDVDGISDKKQRRKVDRCLAQLATNPRHPGLHSQRYEAFDSVFGESVWESYVENRNPSARRVWWAYGPARGQITVLMVGPDP
jgi:hypothetical protein